MNFKDVVTKAGFVMGVNWLVGAKLLGAGALLQTSELGGFVDPNHIAGFTYNEIDGGWYETPPSPDLGQFAWEHPASAEKQASLSELREITIQANTVEGRSPADESFIDNIERLYGQIDNTGELAGLIDHLWDVAKSVSADLTKSISNTIATTFTTSTQVRPPPKDPLTLDLDNDGLETIGINPAAPILFDHDGDGIKTATGWIKPDDALLVFDRDGNGLIDNGSELFGDATDLYTGGKAADGFAALAQEDTNLDGKVDSLDTRFADLRLWRDLNQDGVSQANELSTLAAQGVVALNVASTSHAQMLANGNRLADLGSFVRSDGSGGTLGDTAQMADIDLASNPFYSQFTDTVALTEATQGLPDMAGAGMVRSLRQAASLATPEGAALAVLLGQYAQAPTRSEQQALLDELLAAWAATSPMATTFAGAYAGHPLTVNVEGVATGSAAYQAWAAKLDILERFNGRTFNVVPAGNGAVSVTLLAGAQTLLEQSYDSLKQSVYAGLVAQTRLQPLLDRVQLSVNAAGITLDLSEVEAALVAGLNADPVNGLADLADFSRATGSMLAGSDWNPAGLLGEFLDSHALTPEISAALHDAGIVVKGVTPGTATGTGFADVIVGAAGNDVIAGGEGSDVLLGRDGGDSLSGGAGSDTLDGGAGNDQLYGGEGDDRLTGGAGADTLIAGNGNDLIAGGTGDDTLMGEAGRDVYLFQRGDGADRIIEYGAATDVNVLRLGAGIAEADVALSRIQDDLVIRLNGSNDKVTVVGAYSRSGNAGSRVERIEFADGTVWTASDIRPRLLANVSDAANGVSGYDGDDVIHGLGGNDSVYAGQGNDRVFGDAGNDMLNGEAGDDVLDGGTGDDQLYGGAGNDVFTFGRNSGWDTLYCDDSVAGSVDAVELAADVLPTDVRVVRTGADLFLLLGSNRLAMLGYFANNENAAVDEIRFADGTVWSVAAIKARLTAATEGNDTLSGFDAADVMDGLGGNDTLIGNGGDDQVAGGAGNDTLYGDDNSFTKTGNDLLIGGDGNDSLYGGLGNDVLVGGTGADYLSGGKGNDIYRFGRGDGHDRIDDLGLAGDTDTLELGAGVTSDDVGLFRHGNDLALVIDGSPTQVWVSGYFNAGATQIERIVFADATVWDTAAINARVLASAQNAMEGTAGNDTFVVDHSSDTITEAANQGIDTVESSMNWTLGTNLENLTLTGPLNINGTGNAQNNVLVGNSGNNILDGRGGNDTLKGGGGDDTYYITPSTADTVIENADEGIDTVISDLSYTLGAHVENLTIQSGYVYGITATGNALDNVIIGRSNVYGDIIDGGAGADTMIGGYDTIYYVDNMGDKVFGSSGKVISSIDWVMTGSVTTLELGAGSTAIAGTGSAGNNILKGNQNANLLYGMDGNDSFFGGQGVDTLFGGRGNDSYYLDPQRITSAVPTYYYTLPPAEDTIVELAGEGIDTVFSVYDYTLGAHLENLTLEAYLFNEGYGSSYRYALRGTGNELDNTLTGNNGDNILDGGLGADRMDGGVGNDTYYVDNVGDVVVEAAGSFGIDTVMASLSYSLGANVENLVLTGTDADSATGNGGNNRLDGSQNAATNILTGGLGDDIYVLGTGDSIVEFAGEGTDTVETSNSYMLTAVLENLTLIGTGATMGVGNAADNVLDGSRNTARNVLVGLAGNDTYRVDANDEVVETADGGLDTVISMSDSYVLGAHLENLTIGGYMEHRSATGNGLANVMLGNAGNNVLDGGAGADTLRGGNGNDTYIVDDQGDLVVEEQSQGIDTVKSSASYSLGANVENLVLLGTAAIAGTGNDLDNTLEGNSAANTLSGGLGNDIYVVDELDTLVELANEGWDSVYSNVSMTLTANVEALVLTGVNAINGTGNATDNRLDGNAANNVLDGAAGVDSMVGYAGDDTYVVDNISDTVTESANEGTDTVSSSVTYTLGANVENLVLVGTGAIKGTGNALDNVLIGNIAANVLAGGAGNDTYYVGTGDTVTEGSNAGSDTVVSDITWTLGNNLENLTLTGTAAINGTGNTLANQIVGNAANNTLNGGTGADTLIGGAGNDTYIVDATGDVVTELLNEGTDTVNSSVTHTLAANVENLTLTGTSAINGTGNALDNVLTGNSAINTLTGGAGNDTLNGGSGADKLLGGDGNDTYVIDNTGDVITENANQGIDLVQSSVTHTLAANVENLTLTGTSAINGTGNTLDNVLSGNSAVNTLTGGAGNDTLNGGAGADKMLGGTGNDSYFVDNTGDVVTEKANEGTDTVNSTLTYTLATNLENLTLTGTAVINGTGNAVANVLIGNSAANTLTGNAGNDTLDGAAGADTLIGGTGNDSYVLGRGYGADLIRENDTTAGNTDIAKFMSGIATDQIWLRHVGNNLEASIIGTGDKLTIENWYTGNAYHVEQFKTADGKTLLDSNVEALVQAMAAFAPPSAGQSTLPQNYQDALGGVIAANWQ